MDWRRPLMRSRGRYLVLAAAIPVASFLAALVIHYGYGDHDDLLDAWWWALIHLMDPGSLGDDADWPTRIVGIGLVITGVVVLAGLVLTVVSDAVDGALTRLGAGAVPAGVRDHVVLVGWSPRLGDAVAALRRADEVGGGPRARVVVLLDTDHLDDAEAIREGLDARGAVGEHRRGGHEPLVVFASLDDRGFGLARVADARAVVVFPVTAAAVASPLVADVETLQRALLVERHLRSHGLEAGEGPSVLVALTHVDALVAARDVLPTRVVPVVSTRIATALLRDGLHHVGWSHAIAEVMDPEGEAHVVVVPVEGAAGLRWDEVVARAAGILPLGIARTGQDPVVAPAPDTRLADGDAIVAVAPDDRPLRIGDPAATSGAATSAPLPGPVGVGAEDGEVPGGDVPGADVPDGELVGPGTGTGAGAGSGAAAAGAPEPVRRVSGEALRVLTVGWGEVAATLVAELAEQRTVDHVVVNLATVPAAQRREALDAADAEAVRLRLVEGSTTDPARLAEVVADVAPHAVVVHGSPRLGTGTATSGDGSALDTTDAEAVVALLHLLDLVEPGTSVQADIVDADRARLFLPGASVGFVDTAHLFTSAVAWMASDEEAVDVFGTVFGDPALLPTAVAWTADDRPGGADQAGGDQEAADEAGGDLEAADEAGGDAGDATVEAVAAGLAGRGAALFGLVTPAGAVRLVPAPGERVVPGTVLLVVERAPAIDGSTAPSPLT